MALKSLLSLLIFAAFALSQPASAQDYAAVVAAGDRTDADRQTDARRKPAELMTFARIKTGMRVLDMAAGGGYSTELLARTVGPTGQVYAQDGLEPNERAKAAFDKRMASPAMAKVVRLVRPFDDPLPADAAPFDAITFFFYYHDTTYMAVDRPTMNKRLFAALKPGGLLIIADHAAKAGEGTSVARTLHRIEESALKAEIESAGFKLVATGDFLRHPEDPHDKPVFRPEQPVDEFVLAFERPR
jgi:predicted methyltransferase